MRRWCGWFPTWWEYYAKTFVVVSDKESWSFSIFMESHGSSWSAAKVDIIKVHFTNQPLQLATSTRWARSGHVQGMSQRLKLPTLSLSPSLAWHIRLPALRPGRFPLVQWNNSRGVKLVGHFAQLIVADGVAYACIVPYSWWKRLDQSGKIFIFLVGEDCGQKKGQQR